MQPPTKVRSWMVAWLTIALITSPGLTHAAPNDLADITTSPSPPISPDFPLPDSGGSEGLGTCKGRAYPVNPPREEVIWERNTSQINVNCPSKLATLFPLHPSFPTEPHDTPTTDNTPIIAVRGAMGRGVLLNLTQLKQEGLGKQIVVDVEGCGCVSMEAGVPKWAAGLTFAIRGALELPKGWWRSVTGDGDGLRDMWFRVSEGVSAGGSKGHRDGLCECLPPTLEMLDLSFTPLGALQIERECAPSHLQQLEAKRSALLHVSLCIPSLTTLYLNNNEINGDMDLANCEGGLSSVLYLHMNNNQLTSATTCSWPSLNTLEVKQNWLTSLDLATCPPLNLTSLSASKNYLTSAPSPLPPGLVHLDLSYNNITHLPVLNQALKEADFSHNSLEEVGEGRFSKSWKLNHLNLAHNYLTLIKDKDFYGLKRLHRLDLSHNKITAITQSSFEPLLSLRHLHLHHNHLTHLDARDLHALSTHATHATLHNNPWLCNCNMLAALSRLQVCRDCKHKRVPLQCRERDHHQDVSTLLRTCVSAIEATQNIVNESDEDLSEEQPEGDAGGGSGAVLIVPSLVIIIVLGISIACGYRVYKKHRRAIISNLSPLCCCALCPTSPSSSNNNNLNHNNHLQHQHGMSQLPTEDMRDSDSETEM